MRSNFTKLSLDKGKILLHSKSQIVNELHAIGVQQMKELASSKMSVLGLHEEVKVTKKETISPGLV
jgi:hypothetical protein